jgi:hypothetical protein
MTIDLICEVCNSEPAVGVACVPGIPMSVAYGNNCLREGADPLWALRANVACCGGVDCIVPEYLESRTYLNGEYVTLREALTQYPLTQDELNAGY